MMRTTWMKRAVAAGFGVLAAASIAGAQTPLGGNLGGTGGLSEPTRPSQAVEGTRLLPSEANQDAAATPAVRQPGATIGPQGTVPGTVPGATAVQPATRPAGAGGRMNDQLFAMAAAANDLAEISTAQMALSRASSNEVKQYAQRVLEDHTTSSQQLKAIAGQMTVQLPQRPDIKDQACASHLMALTGAEFDRAYMKGQVAGHMQAIGLFRAESEMGQDANLKRFAAETLPHLEQHLQLAQGLAGSDATEMRHQVGRPVPGQTTIPSAADPTKSTRGTLTPGGNGRNTGTRPGQEPGAGTTNPGTGTDNRPGRLTSPTSPQNEADNARGTGAPNNAGGVPKP